MEREPLVIATTERGRISIAHSAVVQIVGAAAAESYGVVALAGVDVDVRDGGLVIELRVIVEHGVKLAEVASTVRSRVQYELERMVGLPIASLEVHIDGVRH